MQTNKKSNKRTIVLIEYSWSGHRPLFLTTFTKAILEIGCNVIVFCPNPSKLSEIINTSKLINDDVSFHAYKYELPERRQFRLLNFNFSSDNLTRLYYWRHLHVKIKQVVAETGLTPNLVFFMFLEMYNMRNFFSQWIDYIFPYAWTGLWFQPYHYSNLHKKYQGMKHYPILVSKNCTKVCILDEERKEDIERSLKKPATVLPDFSDRVLPEYNFPLIKTIQKVAKNRKIVGLFGSIDKRKGFLSLLRTAKKMEDTNKWLFLFAGEIRTLIDFSDQELIEIIHLINDLKDKNCFFYFHRIQEDAHFNALIDISHAIFCVYEDFTYSSNLLAKAAFLKKLVIASEGSIIETRTKRFCLGIVVKERNIEQIEDALYQLSDPNIFDQLRESAKFDKYLQEHSSDILQEKLKEIIGVD